MTGGTQREREWLGGRVQKMTINSRRAKGECRVGHLLFSSMGPNGPVRNTDKYSNVIIPSQAGRETHRSEARERNPECLSPLLVIHDHSSSSCD